MGATAKGAVVDRFNCESRYWRTTDTDATTLSSVAGTMEANVIRLPLNASSDPTIRYEAGEIKMRLDFKEHGDQMPSYVDHTLRYMSELTSEAGVGDRPVIFDHATIADYLSAMYRWLKAKDVNFSLNAELSALGSGVPECRA